MVAVAMLFAMKNGQICFSLRKFLAISPAIQKKKLRLRCRGALSPALELYKIYYRDQPPILYVVFVLGHGGQGRGVLGRCAVASLHRT